MLRFGRPRRATPNTGKTSGNEYGTYTICAEPDREVASGACVCGVVAVGVGEEDRGAVFVAGGGYRRADLVLVLRGVQLRHRAGAARQRRRLHAVATRA